MRGALLACGNHYLYWQDTESDEENERINDICHRKVFPIYQVYTYLLEKDQHDARDQATIEKLEAELKLLKEKHEDIEKQAREKALSYKTQIDDLRTQM